MQGIQGNSQRSQERTFVTTQQIAEDNVKHSGKDGAIESTDVKPIWM